MLSNVLVLCLFAQAPSAPSETDRLIGRGVELREQGNDREALEVFRKAYELSRGGRALAQLALAEQAMGRWLEAETHLRTALDTTQDKWIVANRQALEGALQTIQQRLGTVEILCSVNGAEVSLNGHVVGRCPLPTPARVVAGTVVLEVVADGYWPISRNLRVAAGGVNREQVELAPRSMPRAGTGPVPTPGPSAVKDAAPSQSLPPLFWIGMGTAIAGAGAAVGSFVVGYSAASQYDLDACSVPSRPASASCPDYKTPTVVGWIAVGIAAVGAGLAVYSVLAEPSAPTVTWNGGPSGTGLGMVVSY